MIVVAGEGSEILWCSSDIGKAWTSFIFRLLFVDDIAF